MFTNDNGRYAAHPDVIFWQSMVPFMTRSLCVSGHVVEAAPGGMYPATGSSPEALWWFEYMPQLSGRAA